MLQITVKWSMPQVRADLEKRLEPGVRTLERAVLESCEPYVPFRTGQLCRSGHVSGTGNTGSVTWSAPHAAECYYASRSFGKRIHPHATARWFEAAKAKDLETWRRKTAAVLTGGKE